MTSTRDTLQRVATHVLARGRHAATGKFGLRATPGGFGTPAFGDDVEVLRVSGTSLVRERGGHSTSMAITGSTLTGLASFAGVDLHAAFDVGHDTPPVGDVDEPLDIDDTQARRLAFWWDLGWRAMDATIGDRRDAMAIQLWPEHFDAGTSVAVGDEDNDRCNLGASPGDSFSADPYLYVGPWRSERPGDASYWNAPFGAVASFDAIANAADPLASAVAFMTRGLDLLQRGS